MCLSWLIDLWLKSSLLYHGDDIYSHLQRSDASKPLYHLLFGRLCLCSLYVFCYPPCHQSRNPTCLMRLSIYDHPLYGFRIQHPYGLKWTKSHVVWCSRYDIIHHLGFLPYLHHVHQRRQTKRFLYHGKLSCRPGFVPLWYHQSTFLFPLKRNKRIISP